MDRLGIPEDRAELLALVRKALPPNEVDAAIDMITAKSDDEVADMLAALGLMVCGELLGRTE